MSVSLELKISSDTYNILGKCEILRIDSVQDPGSKDKYRSSRFSKSNGDYCFYYPSNILKHEGFSENFGISSLSNISSPFLAGEYSAREGGRGY